MSKVIKSLSIYVAAQGEEEGTIRLYKSYDEAGKVLGEIHYDGDGEQVHEVEFTYNQHGLEVENKTIYDEERWEARKSDFDSLGRLSSSWLEFPDGSKTEVKEFYWNEVGDTLTVKTKDDDGETVGKEVFIYNANKDLIEERYLDEEDQVVEQYTYTYDTANRLIKKVGEYGGFETVETFEYQFDGENRILSQIRKDDEGDSDSMELTYHENGNKASELKTAVDKAQIKLLFNEDEKVIREFRYDTTGYKIFEAANKYDENGQLEERQLLNAGKLNFVMYDYSYFGDEEE